MLRAWSAGSTVVGQLELPEAAAGEAERVLQAVAVGPRELVAHHLLQGALAGDVADDGHGATRVGALDQLDHRHDHVVEPLRLRGPHAHAQDELVEEQHDDVVAQRLGVVRQRPQPLVELLVRPRRATEGLEVGLQQHVQQLGAPLGVGTAARLVERVAGPQLLVREHARGGGVGVVPVEVLEVRGHGYLVRRSCSSLRFQATSSLDSSRLSTAMKCDLPEPKLPCR